MFREEYQITGLIKMISYRKVTRKTELFQYYGTKDVI